MIILEILFYVFLCGAVVAFIGGLFVKMVFTILGFFFD